MRNECLTVVSITGFVKSLPAAEYPVEHGVPIPVPTPGAGDRGVLRRPWNHMLPGDSFFVPGGNQQKEAICAGAAARTRGTRYIVRIVPGGVRVWRVQ